MIATEERHADRERDEQEVVEGRDAELPPGQQQCVEFHLPSLPRLAPRVPPPRSLLYRA